MPHDAKPHMKYTTRDLEQNALIRSAAFLQESVEIVHYHEHYSLNWTKERGVEWVLYAS